MLELNKTYCMDNVQGMQLLDNNCVDLVVTSPPYDNLRNYQGYSFDFENVAKELYRVTKDGGVVVWVVGDSTVKGSETGTSFRQALYFKEIGFNLHDTMIYEKTGVLPTKNRYIQCFEYMFIFSKGTPKTISLIKDRKNNCAGQSTFGNTSFRNKDGSLNVGKKKIVADFGYRMNIWRITNGYGFGQKDKIAYEHPATFPESLVNDHILSWSKEKDLILDPFMGSGTVAKISKLNNRNYIGFEISEKYCDIINRRMEKY